MEQKKVCVLFLFRYKVVRKLSDICVLVVHNITQSKVVVDTFTIARSVWLAGLGELHGTSTAGEIASTQCQVMSSPQLISSADTFCLFTEEPCEPNVDLCLIIDSSGSIRYNNPANGSHDNWHLQLEFLSNFVKTFTISSHASRIGAVLFSEQVNLMFALNTFNNKNNITDAILNIPYLGGSTNTPEAMRVARTQCFNPNNGDRKFAQNVAILITDGIPFPTNRRQPAIEEARRLQDAGVRMISIGITHAVDLNFLKEISSPPQSLGTDFFTVPNFPSLQDFIPELHNASVTGLCATEEGM